VIATVPRRPRSIQLLRELAEMVRVQEVLFSLPLAYAGALLGAHGWPGWRDWAWITLAVAGGKIGGMALNRIFDRDLDAANPLTRDRALPAGRVSLGAAWAVAIGGLAALVASAVALGPLCVLLLPVVLALVVVYSFTKRWGWFCHFALAAVGFFLPFAGWIAVTGRLGRGPLLFGAAAAAWYVGFDSLYALRDVEVDRRLGLHSLPADLGVSATRRIALVAHGTFVALLVALGLAERLAWPYWVSVAVAAAALAGQHQAVRQALAPPGLLRFNTYVSCALLAGTVACTLVR
jgi:4-hydroxybenzoate polyprenyltransferase